MDCRVICTVIKALQRKGRRGERKHGMQHAMTHRMRGSYLHLPKRHKFELDLSHLSYRNAPFHLNTIVPYTERNSWTVRWTFSVSLQLKNIILTNNVSFIFVDVFCFVLFIFLNHHCTVKSCSIYA